MMGEHPTQGSTRRLMGLVDGLTKVVRKTADETVNNSTTLQNDDALKLAVSANQVWALRLYLLHNTSAVADIKITLTGPAGSTIYGRTVATSVTATLTEQTGASMAFQGDGAAALETIDFLVIIAGTAGDIQLQWAQNTLEASDTKVLANSCLLAVQTA